MHRCMYTGVTCKKMNRIFYAVITCRSTVQLSEEVKEAKKIADVTSGIEAMSNPNQEVSVSARRGATLSSPPSTGKVSI